MQFIVHVCKLWTGIMIFRFFPIFRHIDAPWWPNTETNITEMLYPGNISWLQFIVYVNYEQERWNLENWQIVAFSQTKMAASRPSWTRSTQLCVCRKISWFATSFQLIVYVNYEQKTMKLGKFGNSHVSQTNMVASRPSWTRWTQFFVCR